MAHMSKHFFMRPITIVLAVREEAPRKACLRILQSQKWVKVVAEATSGLDAFAAVAQLKPSVLLLDMNLSHEKGASLIPALHRKCPDSKVIVLVGRPVETPILDALSCGAMGYLEEKEIPEFLTKAIQAMDAGEAWVPRTMVAKIIAQLARLPGPKNYVRT